MTSNHPVCKIARLVPHIVLLALAASGCTRPQVAEQPAATAPAAPPVASPRPSPQSAARLPDTMWTAVSILGKPASAATSTLEFRDENQVAGDSGCNRFQGEIKLDDKNMQFGPLASTRRYCEPSVNGQETVFLEALDLTRSWKRAGEVLELRDEQQNTVLQLREQ